MFAIMAGAGVLTTLISTIGKVLAARAGAKQLPADSSREENRGSSGTLAETPEGIEDLRGRLDRLEEERDFYKDLLDAPARPRVPPPK